MKQMILEKWNRRYTIGIVLFFFLLILGIVLRSSYGLFSINVEKENSLLLVAGDLHYDFTSTELGLEGEIVVSAKERKEFEIEITSKNEMATLYQVYYEGSPSSEVIVGYLENERYQGIGEIGSKEKVVLQIIIENKSTEEVRIRLGVQGGMIDKPLTLTKGKELVKITLPIYTDESGANAPELVEGMISVVYDETKNSWVKQDTNKSYAYQDQIWANAVTVTEENRATYMSAPIGTEISMEDINTMWVWIPRYSYTIGNTYGVQGYGGSTPSQSTPGAIDIKFVNKETKETGTAQYTGSEASNWRTPDGFTFGEEELSGFWYGKFETGGTLENSCMNEQCETPNMIIKPGVTALHNQTVSTFFYAARSMQMNGNNPYGFTNTTGDAHMSKNSEWGAVAYLSQSKYGKYGNSNYTGANKEIYQNKSSEYMTGMSNGTPGTATTNIQVSYDIPDTGYGASTTGTIYGIYDMSGGTYEYVMGNYNKILGLSGFLTLPNEKYFDFYNSADASKACNNNVCYSHALSETTNWYEDSSYFIYSAVYWVARGGITTYEKSSGIFASSSNDGGAKVGDGFRLVMIP